MIEGKYTEDERKRRLDNIRKQADQISELARRFDRLKYMAEQDPTDSFLVLVESAGAMTLTSLSQLGTLLELLYSTIKSKTEGGES